MLRKPVGKTFGARVDLWSIGKSHGCHVVLCSIVLVVQILPDLFCVTRKYSRCLQKSSIFVILKSLVTGPSLLRCSQIINTVLS